MRIVDLDANDAGLIDRLADLAFHAARLHFPHWLPTMADARAQVIDTTSSRHVTRVLFDDGGEPLAFISCMHVYGRVWEIHPLLVAIAHHHEGLGRRLVADVEAIAARRGAGVLIVGTADERGETSLYGKDLYADPLGALTSLTARPEHPVGFWLAMGYVVVGVTPDAEGPGMPTIHLAKRVTR